MEGDDAVSFCKLCNNYLHADPKLARRDILDVYPSLPRLSAVAERGECDQCEFLYQLLRFTFLHQDHFNTILKGNWKNGIPKYSTEGWSSYLQSLPKEYRDIDWTNQCPIRISPDLTTARSNYFSFHITMPQFGHFIELGVKPDRGSPGPTSVTDPDPLSNESISKIHQFMAGCLDNNQHLSCSKNQQSEAPLRVIDVMNGSTIRLVDTAGQTLKYATLSYCWGSSEQTKAARTVLSNIQERYVSMELERLPKTLSDSVKVIRALGIKYLWIDSLCIVQDSGEWGEEAFKMCQYYENSFVTIIPTTSVSADNGFLATRPTHFAWTFSARHFIWAFSKPSPPGELQTIRLNFPQEWLRPEVVLHSTWATRAWTVQEHMLSSRILYFTPYGIITSCRERDLDDIGRPVKLNVPHGLSFLPSTSARQSSPSSHGLVWDRWYDTVETFSLHELTYQSDKIPAISGVIEKFSGSLGCGNSSWGTFFSDIGRGLAWVAEHRKDSKRAGAPSWSWAAFDGNVSIRFPLLNRQHNPVVRECAKLHGANLDVNNTTKLTLSGPLHNCDYLITTLTATTAAEAGITTKLYMDEKGPVKSPAMLTVVGFDGRTMAEQVSTNDVSDLRLLGLLDVEYDKLRFSRELKRSTVRTHGAAYFHTTPVRQVYLLVLRPRMRDASGVWTEWLRLGVLTVILEGTDSWEHRLEKCNPYFDILVKGSDTVILV